MVAAQARDLFDLRVALEELEALREENVQLAEDNKRLRAGRGCT